MWHGKYHSLPDISNSNVSRRYSWSCLQKTSTWVILEDNFAKQLGENVSLCLSLQPKGKKESPNPQIDGPFSTSKARIVKLVYPWLATREVGKMLPLLA